MVRIDGLFPFRTLTGNVQGSLFAGVRAEPPAGPAGRFPTLISGRKPKGMLSAGGADRHRQLALRSTSSTASGCLAITAKSTRVGASGCDLPCSQFLSVAGGKPNLVAN